MTDDGSSSDDSEDYDVPLAKLGGKKTAVAATKLIESESENEFVSEEEEEFVDDDQSNDDNDDDDDDDASDDNNFSLASLKTNPRKKSNGSSKIKKRIENSSDSDDFIDDDLSNPSEDYNDSDSDDDCAISSLKSPKKSKAATKKSPTPKKKKTATAKKKSSKPKKTKATRKKKTKSTLSTSTSSSSSKTGPLLASTELYAKCPKGKLVQAVLCRWWYAYTWPDPSTLPKSPPPKYDALDGFPGVYICTAGDDIGHIMDLRDKSTCPSFTNFAKKSSEELRTLLLNAIEKQREALIEAEGEGTKTEEDLNVLRKWVNKLNTTKADKEAVKVLKAAGLSL